ncbi:MAG: molybdenum cofactor guanylyltransferase MobA [Burkholderiales bacterium]|nr:molybdenum cofactor guanylyltransferase MobA [Burkholderiales bacterium]
MTGLILAGGLGRRMQQRDKGLVLFRGRPLVAHVLERLAPQVAAVLINANRHLDEYAAFGWPVVSDRIKGFAGPLAGVHAGLQVCRTPFLVTAPCDGPFLPDDLVARLLAPLLCGQADLAWAQTGAQAHPVYAALRASLAPSLEHFLAHGERKIDRWFAQHRGVAVDFPEESSFTNLNTLEELAQHENRRRSP